MLIGSTVGLALASVVVVAAAAAASSSDEIKVGRGSCQSTVSSPNRPENASSSSEGFPTASDNQAEETRIGG